MDKLAQANIGQNFGSPFGTTRTLGDLVSLIIQLALVGGGLLLFFIIVYAGFDLMVGAGSKDPEKIAKRVKSARMAAIGFGVIFVAYWLIRLIEEIFGFAIITNLGFG